MDKIILVGTFKIITSLEFKSLKKTDPLLSVTIKHFIFNLENFLYKDAIYGIFI